MSVWCCQANNLKEEGDTSNQKHENLLLQHRSWCKNSISSGIGEPTEIELSFIGEDEMIGWKT